MRIVLSFKLAKGLFCQSNSIRPPYIKWQHYISQIMLWAAQLCFSVPWPGCAYFLTPWADLLAPAAKSSLTKIIDQCSLCWGDQLLSRKNNAYIGGVGFEKLDYRLFPEVCHTKRDTNIIILECIRALSKLQKYYPNRHK